MSGKCSQGEKKKTKNGKVAASEEQADQASEPEDKKEPVSEDQAELVEKNDEVRDADQ